MKIDILMQNTTEVRRNSRVPKSATVEFCKLLILFGNLVKFGRIAISSLLFRSAHKLPHLPILDTTDL